MQTIAPILNQIFGMLDKYHNKILMFPVFPVLHVHIAASWHGQDTMLLESNGSHASCSIGVSHEFSVILSNAQDKAWSQYKHLHDYGELKDAIINLSSHGTWLLQKWWGVVRCRRHVIDWHIVTFEDSSTKLRQEAAANLVRAVSAEKR